WRQAERADRRRLPLRQLQGGPHPTLCRRARAGLFAVVCVRRPPHRPRGAAALRQPGSHQPEAPDAAARGARGLAGAEVWVTARPTGITNYELRITNWWR